MDHLNVKLFASPGTEVPWPALIPVFHRWIRDNVIGGTLIDVADYAHVPEGPGVLLIAHDAFFSVDNRKGRPGLLYNQRTQREGSTTDKLAYAYNSALGAARLLEQEVPALHFLHNEFEVFVNDRALAPNNEETERQVRPALEELCREQFRDNFEISRGEQDPRALFRLQVRPAA